MNAPLWHAVQDLAAVWRSSSYVQDYLPGAHDALSLCTTAGNHIAAQPFYLWRYLPTHMRYHEFTGTADRRTWLEQCSYLDDAYTTLIEWLRSRLPGYPFPGAPQLASQSLWSSYNVSMRVPWLAQLRDQHLETRATAPTIPFLGIEAASQLAAGAHLADVLLSSPAASRIATTWQALDDTGRTQLRQATAALDQAHYPEPADITGAEDFREVAWAEAALDDATRSLTGAAHAFVEALVAVDRLIQQMAALFSQLVCHNDIRRLGHVTLVQQLNGATGWCTVRSDSLVLDQIRLSEIIAFDHPYPRGVLLVSGTNEQFTIEPAAATITLHGYLLPDSEQLAESAHAIPTINHTKNT